MTIAGEDFSQQLREAGFREIVLVEREPDGALDQHSHPFESRALILSGELTLVIAGRESLYRTGDVFHLQHGELHAERYGPAGVRYLVGRK
jgi:quercetin dioxygenase-like cupin family protein